jgi:hypothetical protein
VLYRYNTTPPTPVLHSGLYRYNTTPPTPVLHSGLYRYNTTPPTPVLHSGLYRYNTTPPTPVLHSGLYRYNTTPPTPVLHSAVKVRQMGYITSLVFGHVQIVTIYFMLRKHNFRHKLHAVRLPQILSLYDNVNVLDVDKVVEYVRGLQQEDGSFAGDKWGEFTLCLGFCTMSR